MSFITLTRQDFTTGKSTPVTMNTDHIVQMETIALLGTREPGTQITLSISDKVGTSMTITVEEEHHIVMSEIRKAASL